jgi:hypothetical protein
MDRERCCIPASFREWHGRATLAYMLVFAASVASPLALGQDSSRSNDSMSFGHHSLALLKAFVPTGEKIGSGSFSLTKNGEQASAEFGPSRPYRNLGTKIVRPDGVEVIVVAVGRWSPGFAEFAFDEPGTWVAKWSIGFEDRRIPDLELERTIRVGPISPPDREFLSRISDPGLLRQLFGADFFERRTDTVRDRMLSPSASGADFRALCIIAELLKATEYQEPWSTARERGSMESMMVWADVLWKLAQEFPESSYAPYAASYAGCCYLTSAFERFRTERNARGISDRKMTRAQFDLLSSSARNAGPFKKAEAALAFAVTHADAYLKPRALFYSTFVHFMRGDADAFASTLDAVSVAAPGDTVLTSWIPEQRKELDRLRQLPSEASGKAP